MTDAEISQPFIVAIDGPSASGKGTIARKLAAHLGYAYLDTGLLYRAVGMAVVRSGGNPANAELAGRAALALNPSLVAQWGDDDDLRSDQASVAASKVAVVPAVRAALLRFQKDFCAAPPEGKPGAVLDGRDIGTVIAPDAQVKIFVTASVEARAQRRFKELQSRGLDSTYEAVLADMLARDTRDAERAIAPAKPAADAIILDTTEINTAMALSAAVAIVTAKI
jgi:cytidylate kinase